jgi:cation:H+ antiporter
MLQGLPLAANVMLFAAAAAGVWMAGHVLARDADELAERTGLGKAFVGLVLLATATELPEIATTSTAAIAGKPSLVLGNMFGGITMQTAVLALADATVVRGALTRYPRKPTHALEAALLIVLLSILLGVCIYGDAEIAFGVGAGALLLAVVYVFAIWLLRRYDENSDWVPLDLPDQPGEDDQKARVFRPELTVGGLAGRMVASSLVILACGVLLVWGADAIADQTGLGTSFIGSTVLAASTSLPEVSTTIAAARLGAYTMAISNIFGSNLIMLALLLPADLLYREGPLLAHTGRAEMLTLVAGILVTGIYVAGLLVRRKPQVLGMGVDSAWVAVVYLASLAMLYAIR